MALLRTSLGQRQIGVALIIFLTLLVLAALGFVLNGLNQQSSDLEQHAQTTAALALVKQALIGEAVSSSNAVASDPGYYALACPDIAAQAFPAEGNSEGACGAQGVTTIGRVPWRSLGFSPLRDNSGECLWYVLSGSQKSSQIGTAGSLMNRDTNGLLEIRNSDDEIIAGNTPQNRAIAAIISPGSSLTGQNRAGLANFVDHCGGNYNPANYLESLNGIDNTSPSTIADTVTQLVTTLQPDDQFNDRITWITREELADAFTQQKNYTTKIDNLLNEVANCLVNYAAADTSSLSRLPWAAPLALADYRIDDNYDDVSATHFGRLPVDDTTNSALDSAGALPIAFINGCFTAAEVQNYRQHWKDHLFYVVAGLHDPNQVAVPNCSGNCLMVDQTNDAVDNPTGDYAAIIIFADRRLGGQVRNAPPPAGEPDTRQLLANYLEGTNLTNFPDAGGNGGYQHRSVSVGNDRLFCIDSVDLINGPPVTNQCP